MGGAECQRDKGRKSEEMLTQQQKLIFKTDFISIIVHQFKKFSCSELIFKMHKPANLHLYTLTKTCLIFVVYTFIKALKTILNTHHD